MKKQTQQGSTELTIIACLVVVVFFALGWIFWQNFIHKETKVTETKIIKVKQKEPEVIVEEKEEYKGKIVTGLDGVLSVKIPNGWEVVRLSGATPSGIYHQPGASTVYNESKQVQVIDIPVQQYNSESPVGFSVYNTPDWANSDSQDSIENITLPNGTKVMRIKRIYEVTENSPSYVNEHPGYVHYEYVFKVDGVSVVAQWGPDYGKTISADDLDFVNKVLATVTVK